MDSTNTERIVTDELQNLAFELTLEEYGIDLTQDFISMEECIDNIDYFDEINISNDFMIYLPKLLQNSSNANINKIKKQRVTSTKQKCTISGCCKYKYKTFPMCKRHYLQVYPENKCKIKDCCNVIGKKSKKRKLCHAHMIAERLERKSKLQKCGED